MGKKAGIRNALITSIISMVLCSAMLIGSTFAWFTDSVTSGKNRISAGNLDVDLLMLKDGEYVSVADGSGDIFSETGNGGAWEPGVTRVVQLAVKNNGSLSLKYDLLLSVTDNGLAKALDYTIIPKESYDNAVSASQTEWTELLQLDEAFSENNSKYASLSSGTDATSSVKRISTGTVLQKDNVSEFVLVVHMDDVVENTLQSTTAVIDLSVYATQATGESDSFDDTYDTNADVDYVYYNGGNFITLWNSTPEGNVIYLLTDALDETGSPIGKHSIDKSMTIIMGNNSFIKEFEFVQPDKTLTLKNGNSDALTISGSGTLVLDSLNITAGDTGASALSLVNSNLNLIVSGKCTLTGAAGGDGINVPDTSSIHISGTGNLITTGNAGYEYLENAPDYSNTSNTDFAATGGSGIGNAGENVGFITIDGLANLTSLGYGFNAHGIGGITNAVTVKNTTVNHVRGGFAQNDMLIDKNYGKTEPEGGTAIGVQYTAGKVILDNVKINIAEGGSKAAAIGASFHTAVDISITNSTLRNVVGGNASAGIGGSRVQQNKSDQNINIYIANSKINATGGKFGAAIGSGYDTYCTEVDPSLNKIHIVDNSEIIAHGGQYAAGVGTGYHVVGLSIVIDDTVRHCVYAGVPRTDKYDKPDAIGFGVLDPEREGKLRSNYTIDNQGTAFTVE